MENAFPLTADQVTALSSLLSEVPGPHSGFLFDGEVLTVPAEVAAEVADIVGVNGWDTNSSKNALIRYSQDKRWQIETGGITVDGIAVDTSRDSQSMTANAHSYLLNSGLMSVEFKATSGWITLSADQVKAVALAIGAHVQACFSMEKLISDKISAGAITTTDQIDAEPWPASE